MRELFFILTACFALPKSQQKPEVTIYPKFKQVYSGDTLVMKCSGSGMLKWFFNTNHMEDQTKAIETWTINVISKNVSGSYHCERDGERSDAINVTVLEYLPFASLSIKSGLPVIIRNDSVVLELHVDTGLKDWHCRVYKGGLLKRIIINPTLMTSHVSDVQFHPNPLEEHETPALYWCEHKTEMKRSNPITIKTTGQMAMLETPPEPAILGKELILRCRVWGEPIISSAVFFKNGHEKQNTISSTLIIETVTIEDQGNYTCSATYKFKKNTSNIPNTVTSDIQELLVKVQPPEAVFIKRGSTLTCTCPKCPKPHSHRWYIYDEQRLMEFQDQKDILIPLNKESSYRCRAMWNDGVSTLSDQFRQMVPLETPALGKVLIVIFCVCIIIVPFFVIWCVKKRRSRAAFEESGGYEEVGQRKAVENVMMQEKKIGDKGAKGEYEAQKTHEKEGEYQTLGAEGGEGAEGSYEALKRSKIDEKAGEYQTLGTEGGKDGEGGYEALKRSKIDEKEGEYQTLGTEGGKDGEGGYEALKRSKIDEKHGEYQTLRGEGGKGKRP